MMQVQQPMIFLCYYFAFFGSFVMAPVRHAATQGRLAVATLMAKEMGFEFPGGCGFGVWGVRYCRLYGVFGFECGGAGDLHRLQPMQIFV